MSGHDKIAGSIIGTVLCLSILALPTASIGLTDAIHGTEGGREEWHGPGDPEGGDRYTGDLIFFDIDITWRSNAASEDPREEAPSIRLIRFGFGVLLIIEVEDERRARVFLLTR